MCKNGQDTYERDDAAASTNTHSDPYGLSRLWIINGDASAVELIAERLGNSEDEEETENQID